MSARRARARRVRVTDRVGWNMVQRSPVCPARARGQRRLQSRALEVARFLRPRSSALSLETRRAQADRLGSSRLSAQNPRRARPALYLSRPSRSAVRPSRLARTSSRDRQGRRNGRAEAQAVAREPGVPRRQPVRRVHPASSRRCVLGIRPLVPGDCPPSPARTKGRELTLSDHWQITA